MSLLLHKRSVSTPFSYKKKAFLPVIPPALGCCCSFTSWSQTISHHAVSFSVCGAVWMAGQAYVCVCLWVILCMCAWGGLWHATLVRGFHQQKSIPLYSAACTACLYWVEIGWTSFMLHAFACCMNTICWRPVGTPSIHLHCFYAPARRVPICGRSPSDF